jgi:hypothetical protein
MEFVVFQRRGARKQGDYVVDSNVTRVKHLLCLGAYCDDREGAGRVCVLQINLSRI